MLWRRSAIPTHRSVARSRAFTPNETVVCGWHVYDYSDAVRQVDSIQLDLRSALFTAAPERLVLMSHSPAYGTLADRVGTVAKPRGHAGLWR